MMRDDKLIELFTFYTGCAGAKQLDAKFYAQDVRLDGRDFQSGDFQGQILPHVAWMAAEARKMIEEAQAAEQTAIKLLLEKGQRALIDNAMDRHQSRREKAMRWLGFIQGVLWMAGVFTLDELKKHSHRCSDDYEEKKT